MHLDAFHASSLAVLATASAHVEAETCGAVAPDLRLGQLGEHVPDRVEHLGVGRGIGARSAPDRLLADVDHLVHVLESCDGPVRAGHRQGGTQHLRQCGIERLRNQRALAGARHARDAHELAQGYLRRDALQVVQLCPFQRQEAPDPLRGGAHPQDLLAAAEIPAGHGFRVGSDLGRRALRHDEPSVCAGARAEVDHEVGAHDRVPVVLHDENRVAEIAQALERSDQLVVVPLVKADRGLVEDVEDSRETASDLAGESYPLRLPA